VPPSCRQLEASCLLYLSALAAAPHPHTTQTSASASAIDQSTVLAELLAAPPLQPLWRLLLSGGSGVEAAAGVDALELVLTAAHSALQVNGRAGVHAITYSGAAVNSAPCVWTKRRLPRSCSSFLRLALLCLPCTATSQLCSFMPPCLPASLFWYKQEFTELNQAEAVVDYSLVVPVLKLLSLAAAACPALPARMAQMESLLAELSTLASGILAGFDSWLPQAEQVHWDAFGGVGCACWLPGREWTAGAASGEPSAGGFHFLGN